MNMFFKNIKEGMYCFAELVANLINTVLLFLAYLFVVGPTAMIAKISGKKFLQLEKTKWIKIDNNKTKESFYRQF